MTRWLAVATAAALATLAPRAAPAQPVDAGPPTEPGPEPALAGTDAGPPTEPLAPAATEGGAIETVSISAPPVPWKDWSIEGTLVDDLAVVRGFVAPIMERHRGWDEGAQLDVRELLLRLGYESSFASRPAGPGGVHAIIQIAPVPMVRSVGLDIDMPLWTRFVEPVFGDELLRRMRLGPGSALSIDPTARAAELEDEARRLETHLQNDGFYDARVRIKARETSPFAYSLDVSVKPGVAFHVGRVKVIGNEAIDSSEIVPLFKDNPYFALLQIKFGKKRFTKKQLNQDVEDVVKLYRDRGFPGVSVQTDFDLRHSFHRDRKQVDLEVEVRERRKLDVTFEGLEGGQREDRLAQELTLSKEGSYDDVEVEASAEAVRKHLQRQGNFEASVTWDRERFGVFERVVMTVDQGPNLKVREVEIVGNQALPDDALRGLIKTKPYRRLGLGETGGYALSEQLAADVAALTARYLTAGFPKAKASVVVARDRALLDNAAALAAAVAADLPAKGLWVRFQIDEGPRVTVGQVELEFDGPSGLDERRLRQRLVAGPGRPFSIEAAEADGARLRDLYFEAGFPRAEVETRIEPAADPDRRIVIHRVRPDVAVRVGKIALRGNFKTREWVIRDELAVTEGDLFTRPAVERMRANLQSSGLFAPVHVAPVGLAADGQDTVNLLVRVEERHDNAGELLAGAGFATDIGFYATAEARWPNAFGTGALTQLIATSSLAPALEPLFEPPGLPRYQVEGRLTLPRWIGRKLFGAGLVLETSALYRNEEKKRFGQLVTVGLGQAVSYAFRGGFVDRWLLSLRYDFRRSNRDLDLVRPSGNSDDDSQVPVPSRASSIGPELLIDRRKDAQGRLNPLAPAQGYLLRASASYAEDFVAGTDSFLKFGLAGQLFVPLGQRFTLSTASSYDHGLPLGGEVLLPEVERYFAGGDTTVRGFEQDRLATEVIEDELAPGTGLSNLRILPAGGNIRFLHRLDLQAKVWDLASMPVASAVFVDTGLVTNSLVGFRGRDLRHSLGVAFARLVSPFGNFSFEWAVPLDPELGDNPLGRFHLTFGASFGI